jgi:hypothetical protein
MESKEHAENLVKYFERIIREYGGAEVWQKGLSTAQEWLRLINSENASQAELSTFIRILHANRYRTSGWHDLALGAYHWVSSKGLSVPPAEEFFASDGLPLDSIVYKRSSLEHAQILNKSFEQNNDEDPTSEGWAKGIQITQEWLRLIQKPEKVEAEISLLIEIALANETKYSAQVWFDTVLTISLWCKTIGYLDLIPDRFRNMVSKSDSPQK